MLHRSKGNDTGHQAGHLLGAFMFVIYILSKIRAAKPTVGS